MAKNKKYYVTTPIYYASGKLHLGHCYTTVIADACARFKRLEGYDVMFLTGSDEHGLKISRNAEKANMKPKEFTDLITTNFKIVWEKLKISYDKFIRTTDNEHIQLVENVFKKLYEQGDIYKSIYEGLYCVPCESFFTESQIVDGKCPDCGRPVEIAKEESYFFKMSKYQNFIEQLYKKDDNFLLPEARKNEIINNFIRDGVQDLCVSRTSIDWGIKVPFDKKHTVYVWIDALLNYISALGYGTEKNELFKSFWPADVQFVGREIARFHAVIWPILLCALDVKMPKQIHSHGWITQKGDKMSKSCGNGFDPLVLCNRYGTDAVRYYLLKGGPLFTDSPYSTEVFLNTINSDLCNDLGNLVSRTLAMIEQYFDGTVPQPNAFEEIDNALILKCNQLLENCVSDLNGQRVDVAIRRVFNIICESNKYIDVTTPWLLAKNNQTEKLATVLYVLSESIRICTVLLQAFLVEIPDKIFSQFGIQQDKRTFNSVKKFSDKNFGASVKKGEAIFKRLNVSDEIKFLECEICPISEHKITDIKGKEMITIDEFDKIELKVGKIIKSENVLNSDKLLKNTILIDDIEFVIVSGIAKYYKPEDIIGKDVVVVTNLKPIKIRGILSTGMILCGEDKETHKLALISPTENMKNGSIVC